MTTEDVESDIGYLPRSDIGFGGGREIVDHRHPLHLDHSRSSADLIGNIITPNSTTSNTSLLPASTSSTQASTVSTTSVSNSQQRATISSFPDYASNSALKDLQSPQGSSNSKANTTMPQSLPLSTFIGSFDEAPTPTHNSSAHELSPTSSSSSASPHNHHLQYPHLEQHGSISSPLNEDDAERLRRLAAEEDKRRRNTAASARFRVKKKQRDQELERRAREQADKVTDLEVRKIKSLPVLFVVFHIV